MYVVRIPQPADAVIIAFEPDRTATGHVAAALASAEVPSHRHPAFEVPPCA